MSEVPLPKIDQSRRALYDEFMSLVGDYTPGEYQVEDLSEEDQVIVSRLDNLAALILNDPSPEKVAALLKGKPF